MKKLTFLVLAISLGLLACKEPLNPKINIITADEMQAFLKLDDVQLVDVRSHEEYESEHISNAQNIDYSSPTFLEDIYKLDKQKPVFVYCNTGKRSLKCAKKLVEAGFTKIYDLDGGISKWKHEGFEITAKN